MRDFHTFNSLGNNIKKAKYMGDSTLTLGLLTANIFCMIFRSQKVPTLLSLAILVNICIMSPTTLCAGNTEPFIYETELKGEQVIVSVHVPAGHMSTVLEISNDVASGWQPIVAGQITGEEGLVTFTFPDNQPIRFMRVQTGPSAELP